MIWLGLAILILFVLYQAGGDIYADRPSIPCNRTTPPTDDTLPKEN